MQQYIVYIDEAGTSANEPATVVVGIIVPIDRHQAFEDQVQRVLSDVPAEIGPRPYLFHATEVHNKSHGNRWPVPDRLRLLQTMMSLPRRMGGAVALGLKMPAAREEDQREVSNFNATLKRETARRKAAGQPAQGFAPMSLEQWQHFIAAHICISRANWWIKSQPALDGRATIICEDVYYRQWIAPSVELLNDPSWPMFSEPIIIPTAEERRTGVVKQDTSPLSASRMNREIHFRAKHQAPLLQLADACAFGLRRYFSNQTLGAEFAKSVIGSDLVKEDWLGPTSGGVFVDHNAQVQLNAERAARMVIDKLNAWKPEGG